MNGRFSAKFQRKAFGVTHGARSSLTPILSICWLMFKVPVNPWVTMISAALGAVADHSLLDVRGLCILIDSHLSTHLWDRYILNALWCRVATNVAARSQIVPVYLSHIHVWSCLGVWILIRNYSMNFLWYSIMWLCVFHWIPLPSAPSSSHYVCEPSEDSCPSASVEFVRLWSVSAQDCVASEQFLKQRHGRFKSTMRFRGCRLSPSCVATCRTYASSSLSMRSNLGAGMM